jgi:hypothetical protein
VSQRQPVQQSKPPRLHERDDFFGPGGVADDGWLGRKNDQCAFLSSDTFQPYIVAEISIAEAKALEIFPRQSRCQPGIHRSGDDGKSIPTGVGSFEVVFRSAPEPVLFSATNKLLYPIAGLF